MGKFKEIQVKQPLTVSEDIETLLRYQRKGIPMTDAQKEMLQKSMAKSLPTARKLVENYLSEFMTVSTIWVEATREGWDHYLREFLYAVADVQAQMIIGEKNIGWNGPKIFGAQLDDAVIKNFMADQNKQALAGYIDVAIPVGRIADWKAEIAWKASQAKGTIKKPQAPLQSAPKAKSPLDLEIERQITTQSVGQKKIKPIEMQF